MKSHANADIGSTSNALLGGVEIIGGNGPEPGRYEIQQDRVVFITPEPGFMEATEKVRKEKYHAAFQSIQEECSAMRESLPKNADGWIIAGSCALVAGAAFEKDKQILTAHVANLGDSTAFLIVIDAEGKINRDKDKTCMLNPLHDAECNTSEFNRTKGIKGGFTRSISASDPLSKINETDYQPEYIETQVRLAKDEKAILLVSCDGMLEGPFKWNPEMKGVHYDTSTLQGRQEYCNIAMDFIESAITPDELLREDPVFISAKLLKKSVETSSDNISILVQRLSPEKPSVLMGVFDGYGRRGGEVISSLVADSLVISTTDSVEQTKLKLGKKLDADDRLVCETKPCSVEAIDNYIMAASSRHKQVDVIEMKESVDTSQLRVPEVEHGVPESEAQVNNHNKLFGKPIVIHHNDEAESKPSEVRPHLSKKE